MLDENISYGKIPDFVLFPLFVLALVIKLRDFGSQVIVTLFNFLTKRIDGRCGNALLNFVNSPCLWLLVRKRPNILILKFMYLKLSV